MLDAIEHIPRYVEVSVVVFFDIVVLIYVLKFVPFKTVIATTTSKFRHKR